MSYTIYTEEADFFIKKENFIEITLILDANPISTSLMISHELDDIEGIFYDLGFKVDFNNDGDIIDICIDEDVNLRYQKEILRLIAGSIKNGSYIQFCAEDGKRWRWLFKNKEMVELEPTLVWDI